MSIESTHSSLNNDVLLRVLRREAAPYTPIWLMRQAGRYLPEYNATRAQAGSFIKLCRSPDLATEVTLQPLAQFALDAAIIFSDILTIPDAMGLELHFVEGKGPRFAKPLRDEAAINRLAVPDMTELNYVFAAVAQTRKALAGKVPLIGFAGSPFTLACYMIEGESGSDFTHLKRLLYTRPDLMHRILAINAQAVSLYLNEQIAHGAQVVMVFDTWGGILTTPAYREFSLAYMRHIMSALKESNGDTPRIVFTKGGGPWLEEIAALGCHAVGIDWTIEIAEAHRRIGRQVAIQGNLDPTIMLTTPEIVAKEARRILSSLSTESSHVFNLGHGILPSTPIDNVQALIETVHEQSRRV